MARKRFKPEQIIHMLREAEIKQSPTQLHSAAPQSQAATLACRAAMTPSASATIRSTSSWQLGTSFTKAPDIPAVTIPASISPVLHAFS